MFVTDRQGVAQIRLRRLRMPQEEVVATQLVQRVGDQGIGRLKLPTLFFEDQLQDPFPRDTRVSGSWSPCGVRRRTGMTPPARSAASPVDIPGSDMGRPTPHSQTGSCIMKITGSSVIVSMVVVTPIVAGRSCSSDA